MSPRKPIRVLVVDDSSMVRATLLRELSAKGDIEVVGTAPDPYIAREKLLELRPDVMTLDIEMPKMDGVSFLRLVMQHQPLPVIVLSSLSTEGSRAALAAHDAGAFEVMAKPLTAYSVSEVVNRLADLIRAAAQSSVRGASAESSSINRPGKSNVRRSGIARRSVVAIGASTGGVQAITQLLTRLSGDLAAGLVIVQHMPAGFTARLAERLDEMCELEVREAVAGDEVRPGTALIAPGGMHLCLSNGPDGTFPKVQLNNGPRVHHQKPAVDVLFRSIAHSLGQRAVGVLLTGMGRDGADGLLAMRNAGAATVAQDERTSTVFGMPRAAVENGAAQQVLGLHDIPGTIAELIYQEKAAISLAG